MQRKPKVHPMFEQFTHTTNKGSQHTDCSSRQDTFIKANPHDVCESQEQEDKAPRLRSAGRRYAVQYCEVESDR